MRLSLINDVLITEDFHPITVFELIGLRIQLFIELLVITVIFWQFSLLKFNQNFKGSNLFAIFVRKPINCFLCSFQHLVVQFWLVSLNAHIDFVVFKRLVDLKFDLEGFPFVILYHVFNIVDIWQPRFDILLAGYRVVFL